ncbi:MAG: DUF4410 domain-containing protein, partial [Rhodospirillales bacterium]|nr:DUF4410 domain-containing protein [Rhodospirillales bacterium]
GARLPRPDRVLVEAFAVTPEEVKLDQGVAARVQRASSDVPLSTQQMQVARQAQSDMADAMVAKLIDYGLPSARVWGEQLPPSGRYLVVQGQIVSVDQGNRTRRTLVGFGAGKSEISADMQLYMAEGRERPRFLTAYNGSDGSGRAPGMAETMGVGGAAGNLLASTAIGSALHLGTESRRANTQSEAQRLGQALAKQVAQFAVSQGWLPPNAVS